MWQLGRASPLRGVRVHLGASGTGLDHRGFGYSITIESRNGYLDELRNLPKNAPSCEGSTSCHGRLRKLKVHCYLIHYLRKQMPQFGRQGGGNTGKSCIGRFTEAIAEMRRPARSHAGRLPESTTPGGLRRSRLVKVPKTRQIEILDRPPVETDGPDHREGRQPRRWRRVWWVRPPPTRTQETQPTPRSSSSAVLRPRATAQRPCADNPKSTSRPAKGMRYDAPVPAPAPSRPAFRRRLLRGS